jgi:hypothetical protein
MDIKQQFVFLMINEDINIISFISDIVFENFQMQKRWFDMWSKNYTSDRQVQEIHFRIIGLCEHYNQTSNKVNNAINNNQ